MDMYACTYKVTLSLITFYHNAVLVGFNEMPQSETVLSAVVNVRVQKGKTYSAVDDYITLYLGKL